MGGRPAPGSQYRGVRFDAHGVATEKHTSRPWVSTFKYVIPRGFPDTAGHLRVNEVKQANFWCKDLDLLWSIRGVTPALDKVAGEARVRFGPGRVADIPAVQNSHKLLRMIFLPLSYMHKMNKFSVFSTATAYPMTLDFARIESEYGLDKGRRHDALLSYGLASARGLRRGHS